jgi:hypothetical protein
MTEPKETVGAYKNKSGSSILPWILGLLALLVLALILFFAFSGGDDDVDLDAIDRDDTPATDVVSPDDDTGPEEFDEPGSDIDIDDDAEVVP